MTDAAPPPRHIQLLLDSQLAVFHRVSRQIAAALRAREPSLVPAPATGATPQERRVLELTRLVVEVSGERVVKAFERALETVTPAALVVEADAAGSAPDAMRRTADATATATGHQSVEIVAILAQKTVEEIDPVQLHAIEMRIGALQGSPPVHREANPIGPHALLAAVYEACAEASAEKDIRLTLLNLLQPHVALALARAYDEVNIVLASEGVLPGGLDTPVGPAVPVGEETATDTGLSQPVSLASLFPAIDLPSPAPDFDRVVRAIVADGLLSREAVRLLTDPAHKLFAVAMGTPPDPGVMASLGHMQGIRGIAVDEQSDSLGPLRAACDQPMPPLDELTGRLVLAILAFTLREPDLHRDIRREVARLQIMAFRAALLDRTFFTRREHPFRRFLDGTVELALDPANGTSGDGVLISTLRRVVDGLSAEFRDDLEIFSGRLGDLKNAVDFAADPESEGLRRAIEALPEIEAREISRRRAREEIEARITPSTPRFLANFLASTFADLLAGIRRGPDGEALWEARLALVDQLVWSVAPKNRETVGELARALPGLVAAVRDALDVGGVPEDTKQSLLDALFVAHHGVMRHARTPEADRVAAQAAAEAAAQAAYRPIETSFDGLRTAIYDEGVLLRIGLLLDFFENGSVRRAKVVGIGPERAMCALAFQDGTVWHRHCDDIERLLDAGAARLLTPARSIVARAIAATTALEPVEGKPS